MFFYAPSLQPLLSIDTKQDFFKQFTGLKNIAGGVAVYGSAAAYALVWELGSLRLKKPGPRTVWGTNRDGQRRIMSSQAPEGYVGINESKFWPIIEAEFAKVDFQNYTGKALQMRLEVAMDNASQKIARIVSDAAPKDSGDLSSQIELVDSDNTSILGDASRLTTSGTLII